MLARYEIYAVLREAGRLQLSSFRNFKVQGGFCHRILFSRSAATGFKVSNSIKWSLQLLNLGEDCTADELKDTYLTLAKRYHPDSRSPDADATKFTEVRDAYQTISAKLAEEAGKLSSEEVVDILEPDFGIKQTTPQHRQYLSFEGVGYGTPSQRQKQYQYYRADKASERVFEYNMRKHANKYEYSMTVKDKTAARQIKTSSGMHRLVEDLIRDSMEKGEFDNLEGAGKPLTRTDYNPMVDSMTHNLNKILINSGCAPDWVMLNGDVRKQIRDARKYLKLQRSRLGPHPFCYGDQQRWDRTIDHFVTMVKDLNKQIDRLNMLVPTMRQQLPHMSLEVEIQRALNNHVVPGPPQCKEEVREVPEKDDEGIFRKLIDKVGGRLVARMLNSEQ
ncbi:dnaJ homolog subfamily C member 28-like [Saccoglossus kowalevskii]|uniref:DnaJ homolog subfamily C member 28-like n=1 Tax=Saccoglossus kowalevskii TaxID=10224 RepID=A0ABM0M530_SACKO|nr:PREDICTED: dnaJ homolog subfamily C member 28-like [Saccoglossus kowalevskii]